MLLRRHGICANLRLAPLRLARLCVVRLCVISLCVVAAIAWGGVALAQSTLRYPGAAWDQPGPAQSGWSGEHLAAAQTFSHEIGSAAVVVVQHGAIVTSWGDTTTNMLLNSARKSLLSALMGTAVGNGQVHLDDTLALLGIDDVPLALTDAEKQATVRDLLEARSGIYHAANYETSDMEARRPARGSHPHGTYWYYNNWDFNALGAIYQHATGTSIFAAFAQQIAAPIGMQDFNPAQCRYSGGPSSRYPAYLFYASARDLARLGLLMLHMGRWQDRQIIPASWVQESTRSYSVTNRGTGYAYLWWTLALEGASRVTAPPGTYWAEGNGGQVLFIVPAYDLVVVHLARYESDTRGRNGVAISKVLRLMEIIEGARPAP